MSAINTSAILLRRIDHGDYDLVVTFLTLNQGKISLIAKSAKKSVKRFAGVLELFSVLDIVYRPGRGRGLSVLQEAALKAPLDNIRADMGKTAYASYWAELINIWTEQGAQAQRLFKLLLQFLEALDRDQTGGAMLSVVFQMRFLNLAGLTPNLTECLVCGRTLEQMQSTRIALDAVRGGLLCEGCSAGRPARMKLSKGTVKQLLWIERGGLAKAIRIRFSDTGLRESQQFLETFIPYHLGRKPRSLGFLQQIRRCAAG